MAGTTAGLAGLAACEPAAVQPGAKPFDPASWTSVKQQFALDTGLSHLAAFVFSSHPAPVRARIAQLSGSLDRDPTGFLRGEAEFEQKVGAAAAAYLGGSPDHIAYTDSTTAGLGLLYSGLKLAPGDEILTTEHDFYATHESLRLLAARTGVTVRKVRLYAEPAMATVDGILSALGGALTPQVKVVAITWVHSGTGVRLPVRALVDVVRRKAPGALVCLDAVHGFGALPERPGDLGVDFFVSGGHKWLFGPRGTGIIWGTPEAWSRYTPVVPTFERAALINWILGETRPVSPGAAATPGGYHTFEHRWALADAFEFHTRIGREKVADRTRSLAARLRSGLTGLDHVILHTPAAELSAGILCCEVRGNSPGQAVNRLRAAKVVASVTPYPRELLRLGTSIATDESDVDRAVTAIRDLR